VLPSARHEPRGHEEHADAPALLKVPTAHWIDALEPDGQYEPGGHAVPAGVVAPAAHVEPALQGFAVADELPVDAQ
jgi:hypothetical protein